MENVNESGGTALSPNNAAGLNQAAFPLAGDLAGGTVVFDPDSGISKEEQREILAGINSLTEKNRLSLAGNKPALRAGKKGSFFPVLVNIAAVIVLGGGFFLLSSFHGKDDLRFREGTQVYSPAERTLIEEIRRETASRLAAKENEISQIMSKLTGVDAELQDLQVTAGIEAEQRREALQKLQEEYRANLFTLQDERSQILEASRAREASLHAQLEARTRELNTLSEQSQAALSSARSELERLTGEQEKAAVIESQLGGYYSTVNDQIRAGRFEEASQTIRAMEEFLNTPAFQGIRSIQSRKGLYLSGIKTLETMIDEARKNAGGASADSADTEKIMADLQSRNTLLEENIAELNRTIAAYTSQGSDLGQRIIEFEETASALRALNQALEQSAAEKENTIAALRSQNSGLTQTIAARESRIAELQAETASQAETIESLNTQLTSIRQALQALTQ
jgi:chromosome segregation ATPase